MNILRDIYQQWTQKLALKISDIIDRLYHMDAKEVLLDKDWSWCKYGLKNEKLQEGYGKRWNIECTNEIDWCSNN